MNKNFTLLYIALMATLLLAFASPVHGEVRKPVDTLYYYMRIDTFGVDLGYLRIDSVHHDSLIVDHVKGDHALWQFKDLKDLSQANYYRIINGLADDTMRFKAPVSCDDTIARIDENGNLLRWEQLFLDKISNRDTLVASCGDGLTSASFFLVMGHDGVIRLERIISTAIPTKYPPIRFRIERAHFRPDESKSYQLQIDTLGIPATDPVGFLAMDSVLRTDSLIVDSLKNAYSLWKFETDTVVNDTAYYKIKNTGGSGKMLSFNVPGRDTVAVVSETGKLNSWLIPFFREDKGVGQFMARDTTTGEKYFLGLKDSVVMLVSDTSSVKLLNFVLKVDVPPAEVFRFDSTEIYTLKKLSGKGKGKYMTMIDTIYGNSKKEFIDSVYAHVPDGQFVVNVLNKNSLINRNVRGMVTDTFQYALKSNGDTIPDVFVYAKDTVEVKPVRGVVNKKDPFLGYKNFTTGDLSKDSCFYLTYSTIDSLTGWSIAVGEDSSDGASVYLKPPGDTSRFFFEFVRTDSATEAPAPIASLRRNIYKIHLQSDTALYAVPNKSPLTFSKNSDLGFLFKEGETQGEYAIMKEEKAPLIAFFGKFIVDSVKKTLESSTVEFSYPGVPATNNRSLFRIVKTEIPIFHEDEFEYLNYLPQGRGLYEVHTLSINNNEDRMLAKNFYNYAVFAKEGESILRAGSYIPADFYLWLDTARGPVSNRFRTSVYIVQDVQDTSSFNIRGNFLHVSDSTANDFVRLNNGKKYGRGNFVPAQRKSPNSLQLADAVIGEGTLNEDQINEYRFYLQRAEPSVDTAKYYLVTEKGYGGHRDSTGYFSYSSEAEKYYFGPRTGTYDKLVVTLKKSVGTVANETVRPKPSLPPEISPKEITALGESGQVIIQNAMGKRIQIYNIVGQVTADKIAASDNEVIPVSRGIVIVKIGPAITKKVVVR